MEGEVLCIGHGGAGFETLRNTIPPNTLASVQQAIEVEGADGVEIDVQMSADGVLILFHDDRLDSKTDCSDCIAGKTALSLDSCRYQTRNGPLDGKYPVARLEDVFEWLESLGEMPWLFLNVKTPGGCGPIEKVTFAEELVRLINTYGYLDRVLVETIDESFLQTVQAVSSEVKLVYDAVEFKDGLSRANASNYWGMALPNGDVTAEQVEEAHASGRRFIIWGVKVLGDSKRAVEKSPDGVMTDDVRMLRGILGR